MRLSARDQFFICDFIIVYIDACQMFVNVV